MEIVRAGLPVVSVSPWHKRKSCAASSSSRFKSSASCKTSCWNSSLTVYSSPDISIRPITPQVSFIAASTSEEYANLCPAAAGSHHFELSCLASSEIHPAAYQTVRPLSIEDCPTH